jgi:hypothetical protein
MIRALLHRVLRRIFAGVCRRHPDGWVFFRSDLCPSCNARRFAHYDRSDDEPSVFASLTVRRVLERNTAPRRKRTKRPQLSMVPSGVTGAASVATALTSAKRCG